MRAHPQRHVAEPEISGSCYDHNQPCRGKQAKVQKRISDQLKSAQSTIPAASRWNATRRTNNNVKQRSIDFLFRTLPSALERVRAMVHRALVRLTPVLVLSRAVVRRVIVAVGAVLTRATRVVGVRFGKFLSVWCLLQVSWRNNVLMNPGSI